METEEIENDSIIRCSMSKKLIMLFLYALILLMLFVCMNQYGGILVFLVSGCFFIVLFLFFDILFFKELLITRKSIVKKWYFMELEVKNENLQIFIAKRLFTGQVIFKDKTRSYFYNRFTVIEIFILETSYKKFKEILMKNNLVKSDGYEWE